MKMYKLLFFFLALITLNSCVEYVDNGVKPENGETPEEKKLVATLKETTAKYVGDRFEFEAKLNGIDVTSTTKFTVNGTDTKGSYYVPFKEGSHSVIATMDNLTATFKFTVLAKEEEPEPEEGNRIEYAGKSYPVSTNLWLLYFTSDGKNIATQNINGVPHTVWLMYTGDNSDPDKAKNFMLLQVFVPAKKLPNGEYNLAFPNESAASPIVHNQGNVFIGGTEVFKTKNVAFTFAATGNTTPADLDADFPWSAKSNYTALATGEANGNSAELFWNGDHTITGTLAGASKGVNTLSFKPINSNKTQFKNFKIVK